METKDLKNGCLNPCSNGMKLELKNQLLNIKKI